MSIWEGRRLQPRIREQVRRSPNQGFSSTYTVQHHHHHHQQPIVRVHHMSSSTTSTTSTTNVTNSMLNNVGTHRATTGKSPTVREHQNFDPALDAANLRKAMKGFGTNEEALINIICKRNNIQRQIIRQRYQTHIGRDLIEDIKSDTSGNFKKVLMALLLPVIDFYCVEIREAFKKKTGEPIIELMCHLTNAEIRAIKMNYNQMYNMPFEQDALLAFTGDFLTFVIMLSAANRDESDRTDSDTAEKVAYKLKSVLEMKTAIKNVFVMATLLQTNWKQLHLIFDYYERMAGHQIERDIQQLFGAEIRDALLSICHCVENKDRYFALKLKKSMAGLGTNDKQLIRLIVARAEIDLEDIKGDFALLCGKTLKNWIEDDTSGNYRKALLTILN